MDNLPLPSAAAAPGQPPNIITRAQWGADESMRCPNTVYDDGVRAGDRAPHRGKQRLRTAGFGGDRPIDLRLSHPHVGLVRHRLQRVGRQVRSGFRGPGRRHDQTGRGRPHRRVQQEHLGRGDARQLRCRAADTDPIAHRRTTAGLATGHGPRRPKGHSRFDVGTAGRSPTSRAGATPTLPSIFTHRDVGNTECPGNAAYAVMDQIRDIAARFNEPPVPPEPDRLTARRRDLRQVGVDGRRRTARSVRRDHLRRRAREAPATPPSRRARSTGRRRAGPNPSPERSMTRGRRWVTSAVRLACRPAARFRNRSGSCRTSSTAR